MADERKSSRHYDLNKTQKRNFDLEKDVDATPLPIGGSHQKSSWPKIVIPIVVVAIIAVVAFLVWPKGDKTNEEQIVQNTVTDVQSTDTQDNTTANDNAADNSVENENQTAEQTVDEVSAPAEETSQTTEAIETTTEDPAVAQPAVNNSTPKPSSQPKPANNTTLSRHTSGALTGDVEEDAKAVIRGEFGNGDERKAALGDSYTKIQNRVNEIYKTNGGF